MKVTNEPDREPVDQRVAKSVQTRQRILDTATQLFLSEGYANTSLERVAAEAHVTKPTVYSHYKSKKGLFDAVIGDHASERLMEISQFLEPTSDPTADLTKIGDLLLSKILGEDTCRWDRLAAAESINHPEIGEAFYNVGPAQLLKRLGEYFAFQTKQGRMRVEDPLEAAELFVGMLVTLDVLRIHIGQPVTSAAKQNKRCRTAVAVFMASYGVEAC